jgi:hypothetical protein
MHGCRSGHGGRCRRRHHVAGLVVIAAALIWAPSALAADTFVDQATGNDSNDCLTAQSPCLTVTGGIGKAGANDTIHVAPGTYDEGPTPPTITGGQSLRASGPVASTILGTTYVNSTGTVQGFTFEGNHATDNVAAVRVIAAGTLRGNVFDANDADTPLLEDLRIEFNSGSPTVTQNTFTDNGAGDSGALESNTQGSPQITGNNISGYLDGIITQRGSATISGNDISAIYNSGNIGAAIVIGSNGTDSVAPTLAGNFIHDPTNVGGLNPVPVGITIGGDGSAAAPTTGATLHRNRVLGYSPAVFVVATDGAVTLDSDLLVGAPDGLNAFENNPAPPGSNLGDVTATNATIIGGSRAIVIQEIHLTLDSTIVDQSINDSGGRQTSCPITFSRGVGNTSGSSNGCNATNFATAANPQFVNSAAGNYHLLSTSPLLGVGNPADPGAALDFDGDPRAVASICGGTIRRDIGADEYVPDCTPPDTQIDSGPVPGSLTNQRSASFSFSSEPGASFECSLDGAAFSGCTSPQAFSELADGSHTFSVRARDTAGNVDTSAATRTWTIDATPPDTQIDSGPAEGSTSGPSVAFGFSSEAGASLECSLDGAAFSGCGSPAAFSGLASGAHSFAVRATDVAGNTNPTPTVRNWQVDATSPDTTPPETALKKVKVKGRTAKVKFRSDEPGSTFTCKLDRGTAKRCSSPKVYRHLKPGKHRVRVDATDQAGNRDRTPATARFKISR